FSGPPARANPLFATAMGSSGPPSLGKSPLLKTADVTINGSAVAIPSPYEELQPSWSAAAQSPTAVNRAFITALLAGESLPRCSCDPPARLAHPWPNGRGQCPIAQVA